MTVELFNSNPWKEDYLPKVLKIQILNLLEPINNFECFQEFIWCRSSCSILATTSISTTIRWFSITTSTSITRGWIQNSPKTPSRSQNTVSQQSTTGAPQSNLQILVYAEGKEGIEPSIQTTVRKLRTRKLCSTNAQ